MAILAAIWLVAAVVVGWTRAVRPSPEALAKFVEEHPLTGLSGKERARTIEHVAGQLNRLDFEQRQEFRKLRVDRRLFEQMTPEERQGFLDATLPEGFRQLMLALNKMEPERRQKMVKRALTDLEQDQPEINSRLDQAEVQKFISQGVSSFYEEANAEVKLDFAPVIEQLQRVTQGRH